MSKGTLEQIFDSAKFQSGIRRVNVDPRKMFLCSDCGEHFHEDELYKGKDGWFCNRCLEDRERVVENERRLHHGGNPVNGKEV